MGATVVISRMGGDDAAARQREDELASLCAQSSGVKVLLTPPLYHLPDDSPVWRRLSGGGGTLVVASWLHPRPMEWLLHRRGVDGPRLLALHIGAFADAGECFAAVSAALEAAPAEASAGTVQELQEPVAPRWYPVVDVSRCADCSHCLQFCLFGVYARDEEGNLVVANPDRCKPGCPACSRICPEGAIMFPLYVRDEAIAGAPGKVMAPDLAARRMYYARAQAACPACGGRAGLPGATPLLSPDGLCLECGRPASPPAPDAPQDPEDRAVLDDIDALIDDLDNLARRRA